jgi:ABC-type sugar transport system ATPase subunit
MDSNVATSQPFRLEMLAISKSFPGVQALSEVNLRVRPGEVHGLLGENGAGKSTLIKILSGAYSRDSGRILLDGEEITIHSPHHALQLGIVTIYQDFNLALELTVAENVFMGRIPMRGPWVNWKILFSDTQKLLDQLDAGFPANTITSDLSPAQRQLVEIAKALSMTARVIVLDEPTSALTSKEVDTLFATIGRLRQTGVSIILITHRLPEVFRICDRLTVLRDGH